MQKNEVILIRLYPFYLHLHTAPMSKSDNARRQITSIHLDRYVDMKIRLRNALKIDSFSHYNSHSSCNLGLFMETCMVNNKINFINNIS